MVGLAVWVGLRIVVAATVLVGLTVKLSAIAVSFTWEVAVGVAVWLAPIFVSSTMAVPEVVIWIAGTGVSAAGKANCPQPASKTPSASHSVILDMCFMLD